MTDLFPEVAGHAPAPPCKTPYFIAAVWSGSYWKVWDAKYESPDCQSCVREMARLQSNGWSHITVLRLPSKLWEEA